MRTTGSTVLIAGGTSGIGLDLALRFHAAGNRVIVAGRRREHLERIGADHPGIEGRYLDVDDQASVTELFDTVTAAHPELDALIVTAGIMRTEAVLDPRSLATAEQTVTTNLLGTIRLVHAFTPFLTGRPEAAIVTVTSGLAYVPLPAAPTYSATKAAVHSYTESLRAQLRQTSVQVIEIAPPLTRTMLLPEATDTDHAMPLDDFGDEVMALLRSRPEADQVVVERVKPQRFATAEGRYDAVFAAQSGH